MFTNISWQNYIIAVAITLTVYYVVIGLRYYLPELKALLTGKRRLSLRGLAEETELDEDQLLPILSNRDSGDYSFEAMGEDEFAEVEKLIARLKEGIQTASRRKYVKPEFKQFLHTVLRQYPSVKTSPFRSSVNEFIVSECENSNSVALNAEEVDQLWNQLV